MEHMRTLLFAALALCIAMVVVIYPSELFQIVAAAVIILSTASTLVFFAFVIRTAFRSVNERAREQRVPVNQMQSTRAAAEAKEPSPPMAPAKPS